MSGMDGQLVEIHNTHRVIESALAAGLDVARPVRDDGVDLIAYRRKGEGPWFSIPIQIKSRFDVEKKYIPRAGLVMAYVCANHIYVIRHADALEIADRRGYLNTPSWKDQHA